MGDMGGLMKQAQKQMRDMQRQMNQVEEDLRDRVVEGSSGGGMVKVLFNGMGEAVDVKIDPEILEDEDPEFIQEMVLAAIHQGQKKASELEEAERGKVAGKMNLPGLEGLL
jgi:hypothetical protein